MKKLDLVLVMAAFAAAGCSRGADEAQAGKSVAEQAAELEKQAEVQAAVGDKAGAEAMREQAAALRAGTATPGSSGHAGD